MCVPDGEVESQTREEVTLAWSTRQVRNVRPQIQDSYLDPVPLFLTPTPTGRLSAKWKGSMVEEQLRFPEQGSKLRCHLWASDWGMTTPSPCKLGNEGRMEAV